MSEAKASGLLIRLPVGARASLGIAAGQPLRAAGVSFELEPLFTTVLASPSTRVGAAGNLYEWHVARATGNTTGAHPWELAHETLSRSLGIAGTDVLIEPDLEQQWFTGSEQEVTLRAEDETCTFHDQDQKLPWVEGEFAWHLGDAFSQLRSAREAARASSHVVRIAHLDTGYDPEHSVRPPKLRPDLQRNFLNDQPSSDAHDPGKKAVMKHPGHGTGTLSILAGGPFRYEWFGYSFNDSVGGAPDAEIVPVRVARSVVQLYTSTIAAGINYAAELANNSSTRVDVLSMSLGGLASQAWADAVNKAYLAGVVCVCAAGNNVSGGFFAIPTRFIVYPARFRRVIAACGVMANARPYYGLPFGVMQGNWGPASKMATALSAFTPNIPWAELGCSDIVDMSGRGTSAATPQVAAAAALYVQRHGKLLFDPLAFPEPWMRVEAVRHALFTSASHSADGGSTDKLGNGILQAARALAVPVPASSLLGQTAADSAVLPFVRVLTGFGVAEGPETRMLALEAAQLAQQWPRSDVPNPFEAAVPDPDLPPDAISPAQQREAFEALVEHPQASRQLKRRLRAVLAKSPPARSTGRRAKVRREAATPKPAPPVAATPVRALARAFTPSEPPFRRLRAFALDPSLAIELETSTLSEVTFSVPWESLRLGPVGEYLEVIDWDPASGCFYEPVNLDDPHLLAQDGVPPSEGTPQFHQQMVYAVASLTIHNFERALGRRTLWRPGPSPDPMNPLNDSRFVQRLRVYPHALRERNAYYTPEKIALLFGYFRASTDAPGEHMAGGMVFACLSHDIIAHETTHALLDGMTRSFLNPTNPDVHAFHEAFADIVALLQHFTFPEILRHQIASTRGALRSQENLLGQLAGQFGRGLGLRSALRDAIGRMENGVWMPHTPSAQEYENTLQPHARGAILVAAVFDAFLSIYERRTADLLRIATGGTGQLRPGAIHPDLVNRLAAEAVKSAQHVLLMCVRALDYCPPVDITFGEYLRALITADYDLVADDDLAYRAAFIQAFRRRALYPRTVRTLSVESLLWRNSDQEGLGPSPQLEAALTRLREYANVQTYSDSRESIFHLERAMRQDVHHWLADHFASCATGHEDAAYLGLDPLRGFEVRSARIAYRVGPDGGMVPQLLLSILQRRVVPVDPADRSGHQMMFEGGCTMVADLRACRVRYCIRKDANSRGRLTRQQDFAATHLCNVRAVYFGAPKLIAEPAEPFAAIHRGF
jgi:hypothetical protein